MLLGDSSLLHRQVWYCLVRSLVTFGILTVTVNAAAATRKGLDALSEGVPQLGFNVSDFTVGACWWWCGSLGGEEQAMAVAGLLACIASRREARKL
jgi:hypothetical protein